MKVVKNMIRTATLLGVCAMFLLSNPISSYAYGCDQSTSVYDQISEWSFYVKYRLDVWSDGIYVSASTPGSIVTHEYIHVKGSVNDKYYDDICLNSFGGTIYRQFDYTDGSYNEQSTWAADFYGISLQPDEAEVDYAICTQDGNWTYCSTYWQSAN